MYYTYFQVFFIYCFSHVITNLSIKEFLILWKTYFFRNAQVQTWSLTHTSGQQTMKNLIYVWISSWLHYWRHLWETKQKNNSFSFITLSMAEETPSQGRIINLPTTVYRGSISFISSITFSSGADAQLCCHRDTTASSYSSFYTTTSTNKCAMTTLNYTVIIDLHSSLTYAKKKKRFRCETSSITSRVCEQEHNPY